MARATMTDLIARLRRLLNDEAAVQFDDDTLQEYLDARRQPANYTPLKAVRSYEPGGAVRYLAFEAMHGDWEADAALYDATYNALAPDTSDLLTGRWTFAAEPLRPVRLVGWTYDLYGTAADALEQRAASVAEEYSFSADGGQYMRGQMHAQLVGMAREYRRRQRLVTIEQVRGDVNV